MRPSQVWCIAQQHSSKKLIIFRLKLAVDGKIISSIGKGLLVLVGIDRCAFFIVPCMSFKSVTYNWCLSIRWRAAGRYPNHQKNPDCSAMGRRERRSLEKERERHRWRSSLRYVHQNAPKPKGSWTLKTPVSQFTLLAGFKGSKPDFHESMVRS